MASGRRPDGPWTVLPDPFGIREDSWDNWHLSTGPISQSPGQDPVMFYNGATHDARWRIGWISFDPDFTQRHRARAGADAGATAADAPRRRPTSPSPPRR